MPSSAGCSDGKDLAESLPGRISLKDDFKGRIAVALWGCLSQRPRLENSVGRRGVGTCDAL